MNPQHQSIQFTKEMKTDKKIAFLYVQIEREGTVANTSVFWKKTHADQYINYNSHHHSRIKSGIIKFLGTQAN